MFENWNTLTIQTCKSLSFLYKIYINSGRYFWTFLVHLILQTFISFLTMSRAKSLELEREKVNSADNTVSSTGSMWQEVYTTACLAKRIIFSSRATELMLFHSHPGSAYWPVKLPCCGLHEHSVNPAYLFIPATPTRLWFNHWLLCGCQTIAG